MVFNVLFSSLNFCVGDFKHIKTTESKLDLVRILRTRWALFCISRKKKSLIVEHDFWGKIVSYLVYLGKGEDFKLSTELSERVQYSHNQAIKNELNEAILLI